MFLFFIKNLKEYTEVIIILYTNTNTQYLSFLSVFFGQQHRSPTESNVIQQFRSMCRVLTEGVERTLQNKTESNGTKHNFVNSTIIV